MIKLQHKSKQKSIKVNFNSSEMKITTANQNSVFLNILIKYFIYKDSLIKKFMFLMFLD